MAVFDFISWLISTLKQIFGLKDPSVLAFGLIVGYVVFTFLRTRDDREIKLNEINIIDSLAISGFYGILLYLLISSFFLPAFLLTTNSFEPSLPMKIGLILIFTAFFTSKDFLFYLGQGDTETVLDAVKRPVPLLFISIAIYGFALIQTLGVLLASAMGLLTLNKGILSVSSPARWIVVWLLSIIFSTGSFTFWLLGSILTENLFNRKTPQIRWKKKLREVINQDKEVSRYVTAHFFSLLLLGMAILSNWPSLVGAILIVTTASTFLLTCLELYDIIRRWRATP